MASMRFIKNKYIKNNLNKIYLIAFLHNLRNGTLVRDNGKIESLTVAIRKPIVPAIFTCFELNRRNKY